VKDRYRGTVASQEVGLGKKERKERRFFPRTLATNVCKSESARKRKRGAENPKIVTGGGSKLKGRECNLVKPS